MIKGSLYKGTFSHLYGIREEEERKDILSGIGGREERRLVESFPDYRPFSELRSFPNPFSSNPGPASSAARNISSYSEEEINKQRADLKISKEALEKAYQQIELLKSTIVSNEQKQNNKISVLNKDIETLNEALRQQKLELRRKEDTFTSDIETQKAFFIREIEALKQRSLANQQSEEELNARIQMVNNNYEKKLNEAKIRAKNDLEKTVSQFTSQIQELNSNLTNVNASFLEKEQENVNLLKEISSLSHAQNIVNTEKARMEGKVKSLEARITILDEANKNKIISSSHDNEVQQQLLSLISENSKLQNEISNLLSQLQSEKYRTSNNEIILKQKESRIESLNKMLEEVIEKQRKNLAEQAQLGVNDNNALNEEKQKLILQINDLNLKINQVDAEKSKLLNENSSLKNQIQQTQTANETTIQSLKEHHDKQVKELTEFIDREVKSKSQITSEALAQIVEKTAQIQVSQTQMKISQAEAETALKGQELLRNNMVASDEQSLQTINNLSERITNIAQQTMALDIEKNVLEKSLKFEKIETRNMQMMGQLLLEYTQQNNLINQKKYEEVVNRLQLTNNQNMQMVQKINRMSLTNRESQKLDTALNYIENAREEFSEVVRPLALENIAHNENAMVDEENVIALPAEEEKKIENIVQTIEKIANTQDQVKNELVEINRISEMNEKKVENYTKTLHSTANQLYRKIQGALNIAIKAKKALSAEFSGIWKLLQDWSFSYEYYTNILTKSKNLTDIAEEISNRFGLRKSSYAYDMFEDTMLSFKTWQRYSLHLFSKLTSDVRSYEEKYNLLKASVEEEMREVSVYVQEFESFMNSTSENDEFIKEKSQMINGPFVKNVNTIYQNINKIISSLSGDLKTLIVFFRTNSEFITKIFDDNTIISFNNIHLAMNFALPTILPYYTSTTNTAGDSLMTMINEFFKLAGWSGEKQKTNNGISKYIYTSNQNSIKDPSVFLERVSEIFKNIGNCGVIQTLSTVKTMLLCTLLKNEDNIEIEIADDEIKLFEEFFSKFSTRISKDNNIYTNYIAYKNDKYVQDIQSDRKLLTDMMGPNFKTTSLLIYIANLTNNCSFFAKQLSRSGAYSLAIDMTHSFYTAGYNLAGNFAVKAGGEDFLKNILQYKNDLFYVITNITWEQRFSPVYDIHANDRNIGIAQILTQLDNKSEKFNLNIEENVINKEFNEKLDNSLESNILFYTTNSMSLKFIPRLFDNLSLILTNKNTSANDVHNNMKGLIGGISSFFGVLNVSAKFPGSRKNKLEHMLEGANTNQTLPSMLYRQSLLPQIFFLCNLKLDQDVKNQFNDVFYQQNSIQQTKAIINKIENKDTTITNESNWEGDEVKNVTKVYSIKQAKREFLEYLKSNDGLQLRDRLRQYFSQYEENIKPVITNNLEYSYANENSLDNDLRQLIGGVGA